MSARTTIAAALSAIAVLSVTTEASAQHWTTRPQDWGKKGVILLPPRQESQSTLPVMVYPDPKPVPAAKPNHLQFQRFDAQGRPVFANPTTGKSTVGNSTGLIGAQVPLSEVKKMQAQRSLGQAAPVAPIRRRP